MAVTAILLLFINFGVYDEGVLSRYLSRPSDSFILLFIGAEQLYNLAHRFQTRAIWVI